MTRHTLRDPVTHQFVKGTPRVFTASPDKSMPYAIHRPDGFADYPGMDDDLGHGEWRGSIKPAPIAIPTDAEALEVARTLQTPCDPLHSPTLYRLIATLVSLGVIAGVGIGALLGHVARW